MSIESVLFNPIFPAGRPGLPVSSAMTPDLTATGGVKARAGHAFIDILDIRVPTTTPNISEERRQSILQNIQPGDVILETDNAYPGWQRLEFVTMQSSYTHAAIYEGNGKFLEATPPKVCRTDLAEYLDGRMQLCIVRPAYQSQQDVDAALEYARQQIDKPYNAAFKMGDGQSLYCAELVYNALKAMPHPIDVPLKTVLGRPAVAPDSFLDLAGATRIHDDHASFVKNQASHWPVLAGAIGTSALAWSVAGPIGGVAGFAGGLALSVLVGNKMQTGYFNFAGGEKK